MNTSLSVKWAGKRFKISTVDGEVDAFGPGEAHLNGVSVAEAELSRQLAHAIDRMRVFTLDRSGWNEPLGFFIVIFGALTQLMLML